MIPKILISAAADAKRKNYEDAIEAVGGKAFTEYAPKIDLNYDGLLLCGGFDINPQYYNEAIDGSVNIDDVRDKAEFELARAYIDAKKPVFGICRGHQMINVALGGSLYQNLDTDYKHRVIDGNDQVHKTIAIEDSIIYNLFGKEVMTNSAHHQGIKKLGNGLVAIQWSAEDRSVIEAVQHESLPILGVQWHPERMCCSHLRSDAVDALPIFKYFIKVCMG